MDTELVVQLFTQLRTDMNARFDRLENRMDQRFEHIDRRFEQVDKRFESLELRLTDTRLELLREVAAVHERVSDEDIWGRRELRSRLDRCEREIEELKRKAP